jgi:diguanylate cyclase (GGDEF)-like protein
MNWPRFDQESQLTNRADSTPLRVIVCERDPADRWLISAYLRGRGDKEMAVREIDQLPDMKVALDRGEADLAVLGVDGSEESNYWLDHILESALGPVVVLTSEKEDDRLARLIRESPATSVCKAGMSREDLLQAADGALQKWRAMQNHAAHIEQFEKFANCDSLTGLLNRRCLLEKLDEAILRARRYGESLSMLLLDIDRFTDVNERAGRAAADGALVRVAAMLQNRTRDVDIQGRYGGDEFLIIFPHTNLEGARTAAERIRSMVESLNFAHGDVTFSLTVSGGISTYQAGDDATTLTYRAEANLCRAKENGRNHVRQ